MMDFESIDRCAQLRLAERAGELKRVPRHVQELPQVRELEARNTELVRDINGFTFGLRDQAGSGLRIILKRDSEKGQSLVGIIDTLVTGGPDSTNTCILRVGSVETVNERCKGNMGTPVVSEATFGFAIYGGGQGDITKKFPFSEHKFSPVTALKRGWFIRDANDRLDSVEETFELFKQAAMDSDLNPELAAKLAAQAEEAQVA